MRNHHWRFLVERPTAYNPSTRAKSKSDSHWGRTWTLERDDGKRARVDVETSPAALDAYLAGALPETARVAIQTEGRSAIARHLDDTRLPAAIQITGAGIRRRH
jgi:hypothetical protein